MGGGGAQLYGGGGGTGEYSSMDFDDFLNISSLLITGDYFKVRYVQKRLFGQNAHIW